MSFCKFQVNIQYGYIIKCHFNIVCSKYFINLKNINGTNSNKLLTASLCLINCSSKRNLIVFMLIETINVNQD